MTLFTEGRLQAFERMISLKENRIRHNPKKSMKINVSCGL